MNDRKAPGSARDSEAIAAESAESWESSWDEPEAWDVVMKDLRRLKWLDERVYELALMT